MMNCANCGSQMLLGADLSYQGAHGIYCSMDCMGQAEKGGGSGKVPAMMDQVGEGGTLKGNNPSADSGQLYTDPDTQPQQDKKSVMSGFPNSTEGYPNAID